MKLATLSHSKSRDGQLAVVSKDLATAVLPDASVATSLIDALQHWEKAAPPLTSLYDSLNRENCRGSFAFDITKCLAPLPNAPGFFDGSAFLSHVVRARRARGDQMPESAKVTPLMYQGVADNNISATGKLDLMDPAFGGDFEGEFAAITTDVPKGITAANAASRIALFTLFNDITYREIVKTELETKFGFLQSKPNSAYAPIAVTPDELGEAWDGKRIQAEIKVWLNGKVFGHPHGSEMHFSFGDLIAHAARTRPLSAGTIVGTGTVSNEDAGRGFACLTEKRFMEIIEGGKPLTPWLKAGDRVEIEVLIDGKTVFGRIEQTATVG